MNEQLSKNMDDKYVQQNTLFSYKCKGSHSHISPPLNL